VFCFERGGVGILVTTGGGWVWCGDPPDDNRVSILGSGGLCRLEGINLRLQLEDRDEFMILIY
jgi:hypothetical protein